MRVENMAYSLMGLFDVRMQTLYGEGWKAFLRLGLQILATSDDESLFAWKNPYRYSPWTPSLLAESPSCFANSGDTVRGLFDFDRPYFAMTNKELRLESFVMHGTKSGDRQMLLAPLNCERAGLGGGSHIALNLWKVG
jgi:hypothetical protein